jgi:hypothetical protein
MLDLILTNETEATSIVEWFMTPLICGILRWNEGHRLVGERQLLP